jgi:lysyl-tRNA synthetase class 2
MLEWYRANADYDAVIGDCINLIRLAAETAGQSTFRHRDRVLRSTTQARRMTVAEAFDTYARIDLLATIDADGTDRAYLAMQAQAQGIGFEPTDTWSDIFSRILVERVEPHLGFDAPLVLDEYPAAEAALARKCPQDPRVAERFELYVLGVELANGFGELTDPVEQRARFEQEMNEKQRIYGERYPIDEELLAALELMPPSSGVALGFDRLVMLATGAPHIEHVMWTPPAGRAT